jgi:GNAT superfamily N-acetyltransferase
MSSPTLTSAIRTRRAIPEDADACGRIFYEAFVAINQSHNFPPELPALEAGVGILQMLFSHPSFYCVVAEREGRVVGSNCLDERSTIAGLGPVSVDPKVQNCGIGRILMQTLIDHARDRRFAGVRLLQSTFHSRSLALYAKLGFDVREPMSVMQGQPKLRTIKGSPVRRAAEGDLDACNRLCEQIHGYDRSAELREGIGHGTARVVERGSRITGYASGFGYFGHAVAQSNEDLEALIAASEDVSGPGIIVPTRNAEVLRWCLNNGMNIFQPMTLMTMGLYNEPAGAYLPSVSR